MSPANKIDRKTFTAAEWKNRSKYLDLAQSWLVPLSLRTVENISMMSQTLKKPTSDQTGLCEVDAH